MKNDKTIEKEIKRLAFIAKTFNDFVDSFKGQCSYTDRMVEQIIEISKEIEKLYQDNFDNLNK